MAAKSKKGRKKKKSNPLLQAALLFVVVVLMAASFAAGWYLGRNSMKTSKNILLVNSAHKLSADYVPENLVNLYSQRHSFRMANSEIYMTYEAYEAMERMFHAAEEAGVNGFIVTSGYRDYQRQEQVYSESEPGKAQQPGASEHQTGLSFDVTSENVGGFENTQQYAWLSAHAAEYGFIQRYPPNKADITGISYEPWHYRYVGVEAATEIKNKGITLEEYLDQ